MKINLRAGAPRDGSSCEPVRSLVERAYGHLPVHWQKIIPNVNVTVRRHDKLAPVFLRQWNSRRTDAKPPRRGWSVRVIALPIRHPCEIEVFYAIRPTKASRGKNKEYAFVQAVVGALLACALSKKRIAELVEAVADEYKVTEIYTVEQLFMEDVPAFIMDPQLSAVSRRRQLHFFEMLNDKVRCLPP
ncbi:MAG: hypothetical protein QOG91_509 [Candidatus Parcubacteria bacterium]|jgi:hypothetical protein|nr:hypothetical protein [Candidatus Parcubacteria bacterium]